MRQTAGWYTGARHDGRIDELYVDDDGSARGRCGACVNLDDYVCVAASEPAPARADDGARVEAHPAGAKPRHGWSVSATRTIGNVAGPLTYDQIREGIARQVADDGWLKPERFVWTDDHVWTNDRLRHRIAAGTLTAADLDAVRDVPVMPDETPLADMATPDEAMRLTPPSECDACSAPNPVGRACTCGGNPERCVRVPTRVKVRTWTQGSATCGAVFVRAFVDGDSRECVSSPLAPPVLPRDPSPGMCPTCRVQRRERGEVRVHYWRCGCAVKPQGQDGRTFGVGLWTTGLLARRGLGPEPTHSAGEIVWMAEGFGARGVHPTEAGAIAAWREALANAQREEDACQ